MTDGAEPGLFVNRWGDTSDAAPRRRGSYRDICSCFDQSRPHPRARVGFHDERQDTSAPGWQHLLDLVEEAAADGREEFRPLTELSPQERRQVVTLPPSIAGLTAVRHLVLYGSNLVRIPPEIGAMASLEEFTPYTSYRLHWFPYEITRCRKLTRSTVSTRALFGNHRLRPPFPRLQPTPAPAADLDPDNMDPRRWGATAIHTCSVCDRPIEQGGLRQVRISLRVATDVLPLLVSACSSACVAALPDGASDYIPTPHKGGRVDQPAPDRDGGSSEPPRTQELA
ncbi:leucine-rich repeat domain-containing protein [Streptomyces sp. NPDC093094]|uniref:leucine-rich repeat domain-containing protein n=1 Tax=Streptomyces sp. NPDC093094 TaxID=3366026 RepID=UPI003805EB46